MSERQSCRQRYNGEERFFVVLMLHHSDLFFMASGRKSAKTYTHRIRRRLPLCRHTERLRNTEKFIKLLAVTWITNGTWKEWFGMSGRGSSSSRATESNWAGVGDKKRGNTLAGACSGKDCWCFTTERLLTKASPLLPLLCCASTSCRALTTRQRNYKRFTRSVTAYRWSGWWWRCYRYSWGRGTEERRVVSPVIGKALSVNNR